jgi:hypothetical protein
MGKLSELVGGESLAVWLNFTDVESVELHGRLKGQICHRYQSAFHSIYDFSRRKQRAKQTFATIRLHLHEKRREFSVKIFELETSSSSFIACVESIHLYQSSDFYSFASVRDANNKRRKKKSMEAISLSLPLSPISRDGGS